MAEQLTEAQAALLMQMAANEDPESFDEKGEFKISSALTQFALGALDSALLGFPKWLLDKEAKGLYKPEDTKGERFFRGLGTFLGFAGGPSSVIKLGGKAGKAAATAAIGKASAKGATALGRVASQEKTFKAISSVAEGAGGFGFFELLRAPDDKFAEKATSVPAATIMGGSLGYAGFLISPHLQKYGKRVGEAFNKQIPEEQVAATKKKFAEDTVKTMREVDKRFHGLLKSGEYNQAQQFLDRAYTGAKKNVMQAKMEFKHSSELLKDPVTRQKYLHGTMSERAQMKMKGFGKLNAETVRALEKTQDVLFRNPFISSGRAYMARQGEAAREMVKKFDLVRNTTDTQGGMAASLHERYFGRLSQSEKMDFANIAERFKDISGLNPSQRKAYQQFLVQKQKISKSAQEHVQVLQQNLRQRAAEYKNLKGATKAQALEDMQAIQNRIKGLKTESRNFIHRDDYFPHFALGPDAEKLQVKEMLDFQSKRKTFLPKKSYKANLAEGEKQWERWKMFQQDAKSKQGKQFVKFYARSNNISEEAAQVQLATFVERQKLPKFGNLEFAREANLPFWDPNPDRVLPRYYANAYNRLNEIKAWGQDNSIMASLVNRIKKEGGDHKYGELVMRIATGAEAQRPAFGIIDKDTSLKLRTLQVLTKLGLSVIPNASQSTNTAMFTNLENTVSSISKYMTKAGRQESHRFALEAGTILESSLNDYFSGSGLSGKKILPFLPSAQQFLRFTKFIEVEKMNRIIAANAGRSYAGEMAKKYVANPKDKLALRALKKLKINPEEVVKNRGGLTYEQQLSAAREVVNRTQFRSGPMDLPAWFNTAEGKLVSQFKSFAFNQAKLTKDLLKEEVAKGNFRPLYTAIALMPTLGEGVKNARAIATGQIRDEKGLERIIENISAVGAAGMFNDILSAVKYNNVEGYAVGPTFSDVGQATSASVRFGKGKPKQLQRFLLRNIPIAGPLLKNKLVPGRRLVAKRNRLKRRLEDARSS